MSVWVPYEYKTHTVKVSAEIQESDPWTATHLYIDYTTVW